MSVNPRLAVARNPNSSRMQKEKQKALRRSVGLDLEQLDPDPDRLIDDKSLSYGFDVDDTNYPVVPIRLVESRLYYSYEEALCSRLGLACYNFQMGTNFKFVRLEKSRIENTQFADRFITLKAKDPEADDTDSDGISTWTTLASRIRPKCRRVLNCDWIIAAVDDFYKGPLPEWLSDDDLARDNNKYYVVQESDLHENDWLHLFAEIAFYTKVNHVKVSELRKNDWLPLFTQIAKVDQPLKAYLPLEIKRVVVETKEEYITQGFEKLKADNAIFYISYRYNGDNTWGWAPDHKAVIRKTMDGVPEHMCLEVIDRTTGEKYTRTYSSDNMGTVSPNSLLPTISPSHAIYITDSRQESE